MPRNTTQTTYKQQLTTKYNTKKSNFFFRMKKSSNDFNELLDKIYTVKELCTVLDLKERSITDALRANKIKGHKAFGKWLVFHTDLVQYVKEQPSNK